MRLMEKAAMPINQGHMQLQHAPPPPPPQTSASAGISCQK